MTDNDNPKTYLTIKQLSEKYKFIPESGIRWKIQKDDVFKEKCVKHLGRKVLIIEEEFLKLIK